MTAVAVPATGLCAVCVHRDRNCSAVGFKRVRVIQVCEAQRLRVVRCTAFERVASDA